MLPNRGRGFAVGPVRVPIRAARWFSSVSNGGATKNMGAFDAVRDSVTAAAQRQRGRPSYSARRRRISDATTANFQGAGWLGIGGDPGRRAGRGARGWSTAVGQRHGRRDQWLWGPFEIALSSADAACRSVSTPLLSAAMRLKGAAAATARAKTNTLAVGGEPRRFLHQAAGPAAGDDRADRFLPCDRSVHAPLDGDVAVRRRHGREAGSIRLIGLTELGMVRCQNCGARHRARAVYEATALPPDAMPAWKDRFER